MTNEKPTYVVATHNLTKFYGDGAQQVRALDGVDLCVRPGELLALVGPSGSGKSTLLNILGALDRPSGGDVLINGEALARVRNLDRFRGRTIGFVFQTHNLIPTLTARENVEVPMYEAGLRRRQRHARAEELLAMVGLSDRIDFLPNQLSGGQRQRVAIARALANNPAIILADEPTGNLDTKNTADIMKLLVDLNAKQGTTMILVTHNHDVAFATRRVITLRDGRIQDDVLIDEPFEGELLDFKGSALGQAILSAAPLPADLEEVAPQLRKVLERV